MRIGEIVGTVTLARQHPTLAGARLRLVAPLSLADLAAGGPGRGETLVAWDPHGGGEGDRVAVSEGAEAAQPFRPELKPIDAYCAAILDKVHLHAAGAAAIGD
ncbi:MAG: EutN/CcmL family microcompartment protein [Pirellulales bacterium]|nr:EutN/CcmL family microcompartment protein [Pirellulales bacterium]